MPTTGLIIPTHWEAKNLIRALGFERNADGFYERRAGEGRTLLEVCGIGLDRARSGALRMAAQKPSLILICGYGGALVPGIAAGDLAIDSSRSDAAWAGSIVKLAESQNLRLHQGIFLSVLQALTDGEEKRAAAAKTGAMVVEMESDAVRDVCAERKIPFGSLRAVSDAVDQDLPRATLTMDPDGNLTPGFLKRLLAHPGQWPNLIRLGFSSAKANRSLTQILSAYLTSF